jgi:hypothetical protein
MDLSESSNRQGRFLGLESDGPWFLPLNIGQVVD